MNEQIIDVELLTNDYEVLWPATEKVNNDGKPFLNDDGTPQVFGWGIKELLMDRLTQGPTVFTREKQNEISEGDGAIFKKDWFYFFPDEQIYFNSEDNYHYLLPDTKEKAA